MNIQAHLEPARLEKYSFIWSEARLVIAALALLMGGFPPLALLPLPSGLLTTILTLSWIISGAAAGYLLYRWHTGGQTLFSGKDKLDTAAFFVCVVSGINLGIVGVFSTNIGMSIASSYPVFVITAVAYIASAVHLHRRYKAHGGRLF